MGNGWGKTRKGTSAIRDVSCHGSLIHTVTATWAQASQATALKDESSEAGLSSSTFVTGLLERWLEQLPLLRRCVVLFLGLRFQPVDALTQLPLAQGCDETLCRAHTLACCVVAPLGTTWTQVFEHTFAVACRSFAFTTCAFSRAVVGVCVCPAFDQEADTELLAV
jgi:hypothetical protein